MMMMVGMCGSRVQSRVEWKEEGNMHYLHQYLIACTALTVYFLYHMYKRVKDMENHKP